MLTYLNIMLEVEWLRDIRALSGRSLEVMNLQVNEGMGSYGQAVRGKEGHVEERGGGSG